MAEKNYEAFQTQLRDFRNFVTDLPPPNRVKIRPRCKASVGRPQVKRTETWLAKRETDETEEEEKHIDTIK